MSLPQINFQSQESILQSFEEIANKIGKEIQLQVNDTYYRLVDFEFYSYAEGFPDPHTYKNDLQLQFCKFYLHGSGIDITLGDGTNHCGLLIRGIVKVNKDSESEKGFRYEQISGPHKCATEIFSNLHPLNSSNQNVISLIDSSGLNHDTSLSPAENVIKTKRVGLTPKSDDKEDNYLNLPLRYIAILKKHEGFKQNIPGIDTIVGEKLKSGDLTTKEAFEILGYNKKI